MRHLWAGPGLLCLQPPRGRLPHASRCSKRGRDAAEIRDFDLLHRSSREMKSVTPSRPMPSLRKSQGENQIGNQIEDRRNEPAPFLLRVRLLVPEPRVNPRPQLFPQPIVTFNLYSHFPCVENWDYDRTLHDRPQFNSDQTGSQRFERANATLTPLFAIFCPQTLYMQGSARIDLDLLRLTLLFPIPYSAAAQKNCNQNPATRTCTHMKVTCCYPAPRAQRRCHFHNRMLGTSRLRRLSLA